MSLEEQIAATAEENAKGANIVAQIALRGNGIIMAWQGTVHPFVFKPAWEEIAELGWDAKLAKLKDPDFRKRMIEEESVYPDNPDLLPLFMMIANGWPLQFEMMDGFNYEPTPAESVAARAEQAGMTGTEYAYELLMRDEGKGFIYYPILNYADGNLDFLHPLQHRDDTVNSLSDGGAHCGTICDAASPTFMLEHWVRDRDRGTISLANAVKRQCRDTARLYGLNDRGVLAPGYLADINVIDLDNLKLEKPWLAFDLPAGGKRLLQKARGYEVTIKSGEVTFRNGQVTEARPGGLIRGPQTIEMAEAAE